MMNRLLDIENQDSTDYSDLHGEDLLYMADGLEEICNPYINEELEKVLKPYVNIHEPQNFDYIFKNVFLCLNKVLDSIDFGIRNLVKMDIFAILDNLWIVIVLWKMDQSYSLMKKLYKKILKNSKKAVHKSNCIFIIIFYLHEISF